MDETGLAHPHQAILYLYLYKYSRYGLLYHDKSRTSLAF